MCEKSSKESENNEKSSSLSPDTFKDCFNNGLHLWWWHGLLAHLKMHHGWKAYQGFRHALQSDHCSFHAIVEAWWNSILPYFHLITTMSLIPFWLQLQINLKEKYLLILKVPELVDQDDDISIPYIYLNEYKEKSYGLHTKKIPRLNRGRRLQHIKENTTTKVTVNPQALFNPTH